jgi:hypothetical protein
MLGDVSGNLHGKDGLADARLSEDDTEITFEHDVRIERNQWWQKMGIFDALVHWLNMESTAINRLTIQKVIE